MAAQDAGVVTDHEIGPSAMGDRQSKADTGMAVQQLGYIGLGVTDVPAWDRLLVDILGLQRLVGAVDGLRYYRMDSNHHRICLHSDTSDRLRYIGWQVADGSALEGFTDRLEKAGAVVQQGTQEEMAERKVAGLIRFVDPSGYPVELFNSPLVPVETRLQLGVASGFRAGPLGFGHILATAVDVKESEAFYTRVLGFQVTDYAINGGVFMRCNRRHHSLALHPVGSFEGKSEAPQIRHILFEVNDLDDVGLTWDRCQERQVPVATTLGRHSNDHMLSFYLRAPAILNIEYGWGGLTVDDDWAVSVYAKGDLWGHERVDPAERAAHRGRLNASNGRFPWLS